MPTPTPTASAQAPRFSLRATLLSPRRYYLQALRLSLVIGVLMLVPSWFMFEVYGRVLNSRNTATLLWLLVMAVGLYVVLEFLEVARSRVLYAAARDVHARLSTLAFRTGYTRSLRRQPLGGQQGLSDARTVCDFIWSPAVTGVLDLPAALLCLVLLYVMSPWLGALATFGALTQTALGFHQHLRATPPYAQALGASMEAQQTAGATLRHALAVGAMGMRQRLFRHWQQHQQRHIGHLSAASDSAGTVQAAGRWLQTVQGSLLLGAAVWLALHEQLLGGVGMAIVASILGGRLLAPVVQVLGQWRAYGGFREAAARLQSLLEHADPETPQMSLPPPAGELTVEGITVVPPGARESVLNNLSFGARPGDLVMVVGPSASGKSTLARTLVGAWPLQAGHVRLDGASVHDWPKDALGPHVGYLPQTIELFDGTVAENIARFDEIDPAAVRAAAESVGIAEMIEQLPQGYDTQIGTDGAMLSGGQRQRLALARAIYRDPPFLVLDEPDAHLDEAGERALLGLCHRLVGRRATVICIAHRNTLMPAATKLLVLHQGAMLAFGPRDGVLDALRQRQAKAAAAARPATPAPAAGHPGPSPAVGAAR